MKYPTYNSNISSPTSGRLHIEEGTRSDTLRSYDEDKENENYQDSENTNMIPLNGQAELSAYWDCTQKYTSFEGRPNDVFVKSKKSDEIII